MARSSSRSRLGSRRSAVARYRARVGAVPAAPAWRRTRPTPWRRHRDQAGEAVSRRCRPGVRRGTPRISDTFVTRPSLMPKTAARAPPDCTSRWRWPRLCVVEVVHVLIVATRHRGPFGAAECSLANVKWFDQSQPRLSRRSHLLLPERGVRRLVLPTGRAPLSHLDPPRCGGLLHRQRAALGLLGGVVIAGLYLALQLLAFFTFQHSFSGILNLVFAAILLRCCSTHRAAPTRRSGSTGPAGAPLGGSLSNLARQVAPRPHTRGSRSDG